ncbi:MAG: hypothetical protein V1760_03045 [Candidatus Peregrinibacteria bacterium]
MSLTPEKPKAATGLGGLLEKVTGLFGGKKDKGKEATAKTAEKMADTELDKTHKALEDLKAQLGKEKDAKKAEQAKQGLIDRVREAFYTDLAETADINPDEYAAYWAKVEAQINAYIEAARMEQAQATPEFQNLDTFVNSLETYAGLENVSGVQAFIGKIAGYSSFLGGFLYDIFHSWADSMQDENTKEDSYMGKLLRRWANATAPERAAKEVIAKAKKEAPKPAEQPQPQQEAAPIASDDLFAEYGLDIDKDAQAKADVAALGKRATALAERANESGSFLRELYQVSADALKDKSKVPARFKDVALMDDRLIEHRDAILAAIREAKGLTAPKFRDFLDKIDLNDPAKSIEAAKANFLTEKPSVA